MGVLFDHAISEFLITHVGLFWKKVIGDFPLAQHAAPLVGIGGEPRWLDGVSGLPLPRVWLLSTAKTELLQLQGDCFYFNWRKLNDDDIYPRYTTILVAFNRWLSLFTEFLSEQGLPEPKAGQCELSYINHIPQGVAWKSLSDTEKIFPDFQWRPEGETGQRFLERPKGISWTSTFALPEEMGTLTARLVQVKRLTDSTQALRLEMSAKGIGATTSLRDLASWFDVAHESIVYGFTDLTTVEAQTNLWERET